MTRRKRARAKQTNALVKRAQKEKVRLGTLLALRAAEAATIANTLSIPWILETPRPPSCSFIVFSESALVPKEWSDHSSPEN